MANWMQGDLITNGVRLHYLRASHGAGKPPLVLAHGLTDAAACWLALAEQLAGDYDVLMYDTRGHGRSEQPAQGYTFGNLAADMAGLIRGLGLVQPVVIGHSLGAATAGLCAAQQPGLIRALVLEDPPVSMAVSGDDGALFEANWRANLLNQQALERDELITQEHNRSPRWSASELELWAEAKAQASPATLEIVGAPGTPWQEHIAEIACPLLLITGDPALGAIVSPAIADALAARWQHGRLLRLPDAGHCVRRDQPEAYLAALRAFLSELPAA